MTGKQSSPIRYIVGLDLGNYSVGMAAFAVDCDGIPTDLLHAVSHIHDGGVGAAKTAESRRHVSGVARRARRRLRHRRNQRAAVDTWLSDKGFGAPELNSDPWEARAALVSGLIADHDRFTTLFATAVSHIARHRGWRNPYLGTDRLHSIVAWSENFTAMTSEARRRYPAAIIPTDPTPGQLGHAVRTAHLQEKLRGPATEKGGLPGVMSSHKLHQADHARELARIFEVQRIDDPEVNLNELIDLVFRQESPKGSSAAKVGADALVPDRRRVWRADPAFQNYRVAAQLANVRVNETDQGGRPELRRLSTAERTTAFNMLSTWTKNMAPTWAEVSDVVGLSPGALRAPTDRPDDGEDITGAPCFNQTHQQLWSLPPALGTLRKWYRSASNAARSTMLYHLFSNVDRVPLDAVTDEVDELIATLDADALVKLDTVKIADGRGAYSAQTCQELVEQIISTSDDLFDARTHLYKTPRDWAPRAAELVTPTGNAAVDRSLRQVHKMLCALESRFGTPASITVENGRDGLSTAKSARERDTAAKRRATERRGIMANIAEANELAPGSRPDAGQVRRYETVTRQNSQCFYCGATIKLSAAELDHLVPQAGPGSTTTRENLVAACHRCNSDKSNQVAAIWIDRTGIPGTSLQEIRDRMDHWSCGPGEDMKQLRALQTEIARRLRQKSVDPGIDSRSTESTSWMATEVRRRLIQRYTDRGEEVAVHTFGGATTAEARRTWVAGTTAEDAVSVNTMIEMVGGFGKQRLDRRHHALDAAVIAVMGQRASQVLAERRALRRDASLGMGQVKSGDPVSGSFGKWREYTGTSAAIRSAYQGWCRRMVRTIDLFSQALQLDEVKVTRNIRVRLGDGKSHDDTIRKLTALTLGRPWSADDVNRVADHRMWCALTRLPDFDWSRGLPADRNRSITIQGTSFGPKDKLPVMPKPGLPLRGGYVEIGDSGHHLRFYRFLDNKGRPKLLREKVYTSDLVGRHIRHSDLLSVELPEHSLTHRFIPGYKENHAGVLARRNGTAEFLGAVLIGDELQITEKDAQTLAAKNEGLAALQKIAGPVTRWIVLGTKNARLQISPYALAAEGVGQPYCCIQTGDPAGGIWFTTGEDGAQKASQYAPAISVLADLEHVEVIRRNVLGEVRRASSASGKLASFTLVDNRGGQ